MSPLKSLLVATDFSEHARHATRRAAALAAGLGARLEVLQVMSGSSLGALRRAFRLPAHADASFIEDARRMLHALATEAGAAAGIEPAARVAVGAPPHPFPRSAGRCVPDRHGQARAAKARRDASRQRDPARPSGSRCDVLVVHA